MDYIINENLRCFKKSIEDKAEWVVQTAAKIIHEILEKHQILFIYYWQQSEHFFPLLHRFSLNIWLF